MALVSGGFDFYFVIVGLWSTRRIPSDGLRKCGYPAHLGRGIFAL